MVRLAAGVDAERRADLPLAGRLVDVPVHGQQRLALLDQPAHRGRADRAAKDVAGGNGRPQVRVQDRRGVETGVVRRHVDHEDRAPRVAHLLREVVEAPVQLFLGHLARGVPGRLVRPAVGEELEAARDVDHLAVDVDRPELRVVQDGVDSEVVVVARDHVQRNVRLGEALRREPHPRLDALVHQAVQQLVARCGVAGETLRVLAARDERVVADVCDVALELHELLVAARRAPDAEQLCLVASVAAHDRHDRLARQIAGDERDVRLVHVELDGVQELPPRLLGRVEVAHDVEPRRDVSRAAAR